MASGSGFHYSHDDRRRMVVTTNANGSSSASAFFNGGAAALASGVSWPSPSHGAHPAYTGWMRHAVQALPVPPAYRATLPTPPAPVVVPNGGRAYAVGSSLPPAWSTRAAAPPPGTPTSPARGPHNGRRTARPSIARTRSRSTVPQGPAGPPVADTAEATDAEQEELRIGDVLSAVQRSFATVPAALTEQRGKVADMGRQVAAGIANADALAVALEHSMAAHAVDRAMLIKMS